MCLCLYRADGWEHAVPIKFLKHLGNSKQLMLLLTNTCPSLYPLQNCLLTTIIGSVYVQLVYFYFPIFFMVILFNLFHVIPMPYGLRDNWSGQVVLDILEKTPSTVCP